MEPQRPCPACASIDHVPAFTKNGHAHRECRACQAIFLSVIPAEDQLGLIYEGDPESSICWTNSHAHVEDMWASALRDAERLTGGGPLLDVGCGAGQFLRFAGGRGWSERIGVELPSVAPTLAERHATVHRTGFADAPLPIERFALVTMWDVLEHLPDPRTVLSRAHRLLRPGGAIVATLPHRHGISMRVFGRNALTVVPPEHLLYGTTRAMDALLRAAEFRPCRVWSRDIFIKEWTRFLPSARHDATARRQSHARWYARFTEWPGALGGVRAANRIIGAAGLGDLLVAIGQRE